MKDFFGRIPKGLLWVIVIVLLALLSNFAKLIPLIGSFKSTNDSIPNAFVSPSPSISDADVEKFCASLKDKLSERYPKSTIEYSVGSESFSIRAFIVDEEQIEYGQQLCRENTGVDTTWQQVKDYVSEISSSFNAEMKNAGFQNSHNEIRLCSENDLINYIESGDDDFFNYLVIIDGHESFDFVFDYIPESAGTPNFSGDVTVGMDNALRKALDYLEFTAFSYTGLYDQLIYEGFTSSEAYFAVEHCGADWNEQAVKSAKNYLSFTSFSFSGLVEQLEYKGFTHDQAEYGASVAYR